MSDDTFDAQEKAELVLQLQRYFADELDQELGGFAAEFLLDFITEKLGAYYYNRGVMDARALLEQRLETLGEAVYELEKPTAFAR